MPPQKKNSKLRWPALYKQSCLHVGNGNNWRWRRDSAASYYVPLYMLPAGSEPWLLLFLLFRFPSLPRSIDFSILLFVLKSFLFFFHCRLLSFAFPLFPIIGCCQSIYRVGAPFYLSHRNRPPDPLS